MPPSPAMRSSPGRELRGDNHKRGRSLEGGIHLREKDDDLALFNEMQTRERDNFLLQLNDDFEDTFSTKLRYFSDHKLGISVPARGEGSDLLNADGEKNDYDWLLTPPDTPLFPSLDDETPPVTVTQRGRPRSQPITISRSSTMERSQRSSRGSASPNRLSPSPRSGNSTSQMRGRQNSAPYCSPTPSVRPVTPSRRPSTPPSKTCTPAPRSLTPTPGKTSTGSSVYASSSGIRGTSPLKTSRGNSASPKIRAWQTNIPGFSLDAPPNLRTSLADRPVSYVRGSSPASRNGRDSSSRSGRQSMSPTASRSVSSSYSHDRDRYSSRSKGSVASSGDDDVDSLQSVPASNASTSKRVGAFPTSRTLAFSKKPTKNMLSSSAPKRSFDSALRQMDNRKGAQNMFRPLLSSVPSSTFYVGKANAAQHAMISRNSSVTTSSNASSDQGTYGAHDTEGSDQNQDFVAGEGLRAPYPDVQDDVFALEKVDSVKEDKEGISHRVHEGSPNVLHADFSGATGVASQLGDSEAFYYSSAVALDPATSESFEIVEKIPEVDRVEDMDHCSRCGCRYDATEFTGDLKLCLDCRRLDDPFTATTPFPSVIVSEDCPSLPVDLSGEYKLFDIMDPVIAAPGSSEVTYMDGARIAQYEENFLESRSSSCAKLSLNMSSENSHADTLAEEDMRKPENQQVMCEPAEGCSPSIGDIGAQQLQNLSDYPSVKPDASEGAGISILLKGSSSSKGPVVQGRTFTATSMSFEDPSYVRDGATSMRSSLGQGSASASSSVDLCSIRQTETRVQRQLSGRKSDIETCRYDSNSKLQRTGSSLSGTSSHTFQGLGLATSMSEQKMEAFSMHQNGEAVGVTNAGSQEQLLHSETAGVDRTCVEVECNDHSSSIVVPTSDLSTEILNIHLGDSSAASLSNVEDSASYGNHDDFENHEKSISNREVALVTPEPSILEDETMAVSNGVDVADVPTQCSLDTISEIEIENGDPGSPCSQSDVVSMTSSSTMDELPEPSVATASDKGIIASPVEHDSLNHAQDVPEESTVTVGNHGGTKGRSLTLEEATDTILFCSSIVHNLAYEAATIAIEKENMAPLEGSKPMVTILGNTNSDTRNPRGRTTSRKRTSKRQKAREWLVTETDTKSSFGNIENDDKVNISTTRIVGVPSKDDSMKPPKLESKCNCVVM